VQLPLTRWLHSILLEGIILNKVITYRACSIGFDCGANVAFGHYLSKNIKT
jgi:hypothetical protein